MPDTGYLVDKVSRAYNKWQRRLIEFKKNTPGITKADVDTAYKEMQAAIREWEAPASAEDPKEAKKAREVRRKRIWPQFKK